MIYILRYEWDALRDSSFYQDRIKHVQRSLSRLHVISISKLKMEVNSNENFFNENSNENSNDNNFS